MLKVMIVDDEIIVRVGFQSCINWEAYGCQVVSTCESGGDAVEYMNRDVPDIVFTDIMMPGMDGIQLVKYIRENHPDTKVVVLSCVDEIDYVKKAIKLGAEDYILKLSFTQDTLVELITRLKSMIEEERKKAGRGSLEMRVQSLNREEDLKTLLLGNHGPGDNEMLLDRLGYRYNPFETYQAGCFLVDNERINRPGSGTDSYIRKYGLLNIVREYLEKLPKSDLAFTGENEIAVLFRKEGGESPDCFFPDTLDLLNHALKTHLNLTLSMGMGQECLSRMDIPAGFTQARRMAALRFFDGPAAFHCTKEEGGRPFIARRSVQRNMQEAIFRQDAGEAFRLIDSWFEEMAGFRSYDQIQAIRRGVVETWVFISGYSIPEGADVPEYDEIYSTGDFWGAETLTGLKGCFKAAVQSVVDYLMANKNANPEIARFLQYLEDHVDENISLEEAAGWCALGKSQFCILFKKAAGDTFVNYFNGLKMKKAFTLLGSSNIQVQEAASRIGIHDISYFSRLFKKYYNMSPSDVRKL